MTKKGGLDVLKGDKNPINRNIGKEDSGIPILQVKAIAGIE